ncbi:MAG: hypothetical protein AMXMBFR77_24010 [Phycisphaerales bacterium]|nr:hypothetical protein [Phycisphaerales bacterium]MDL1904586.1 hypothetical protein [Synechococcales cyanobacterium CNB]GIK17884.1 MAG: hypothetical protein BroJett004_00480 [Planctomycetota bacterium]
MSLRPDPTDPADMSPDERMDEVGSILARGILRLHGRVRPHLGPADPPQNLPESSRTCLELSAGPRPDGVAG